MARQSEVSLIERFRNVRSFLFDVDGVLTDGALTGMPDGTLLRSMNIKDLYALQQAVRQGFGVHILSAAESDAVKLQLAHFEVTNVHLCVADKAAFLEKLAPFAGIDLDASLYMGDDLPDLGAMALTALPCCPADAVAEVRQAAAYVSPFTGGAGAVRDVVEKVLKLAGKWR